MEPLEPNEDIGELLNIQFSLTFLDQARGRVSGATSRAFATNETEEDEKRLQEAIDEGWEVVYLSGDGEIDNKNGVPTVAPSSDAVDLEICVFKNGWVYRQLEWLHDEQLVEYVEGRQENIDQLTETVTEAITEELDEWPKVTQVTKDGELVPGKYTFEKTGFVGSASEAVAHASGYNRAIKEVLQTEE
ncbi:hypothetical protein [Natronomonas amylolytica]|uniref:hypothetical protein n=1 Tax=Natronomonas amylolytica TaxID=3108498 RepID=UPI00300AF331